MILKIYKILNKFEKNRDKILNNKKYLSILIFYFL